MNHRFGITLPAKHFEHCEFLFSKGLCNHCGSILIREKCDPCETRKQKTSEEELKYWRNQPTGLKSSDEPIPPYKCPYCGGDENECLCEFGM